MSQANFIDLTGQTFGRLTVIERGEDHVSRCGAKKVRWRCKCTCGNETLVVSAALRLGNTKSCGCLHDEGRQDALIDLTGMTFGRLTVIERGPDYITPKGVHESQWWCNCSCGKPDRVLISGKGMKQGRVKSCGCYSRDAARAKAINLTGRVFGKLTVIERAGYKTTKSGQQHIQWKCRCECGRETIVPGGDLNSGNTKSCGRCKNENHYEFFDDYVIGYTNTGASFIVDLDDFERVSQRYWGNYNSGNGEYIENHEGGKRMPLHRFIMNAEKGEVIDHINHDTTDNRKVNLRKVTMMQNSINRKRRSDNTSGYTGVYQKKGSTRWYANIKVNKENISLGSFATKEEAAEARREAEVKYFGEYAFQTGTEMVPKVARSKKSEAV